MRSFHNCAGLIPNFGGQSIVDWEDVVLWIGRMSYYGLGGCHIVNWDDVIFSFRIKPLNEGINKIRHVSRVSLNI